MSNSPVQLRGKLDIITGILPSYYDFVKWDEAKWLSACDFLVFFTKKDEKRQKFVWDFNKEKVAWMNGQTENFHFAEFSRRLNEANPRLFYNRAAIFVRNTLGFLKRNPAFITPAIEAALKNNDKLNWCLFNYGERKTLSGEKVLVRRDSPTYPAVKGNLDIERIILETQLKVVDIYYHIAKSIKLQELKKMSVDRRLYYLKELAGVVRQRGVIKPGNLNIFNLDKNSVEQLEKTLLDYGKNK